MVLRLRQHNIGYTADGFYNNKYIVIMTFVKGHSIQMPANRSPQHLTMSEVQETVHLKCKIVALFLNSSFMWILQRWTKNFLLQFIPEVAQDSLCFPCSEKSLSTPGNTGFWPPCVLMLLEHIYHCLNPLSTTIHPDTENILKQNTVYQLKYNKKFYWWAIMFRTFMNESIDKWHQIVQNICWYCQL